MSLIIYAGNNNVVELTGLKNSITNAIDTGATVNVTIKDASGTEVSGDTWPKNMPHVSSGLYRVTLDYDLIIDTPSVITVVIDAIGSGGEVGHWEIPARAIVRNA
jgi:hypothetical protein